VKTVTDLGSYQDFGTTSFSAHSRWLVLDTRDETVREGGMTAGGQGCGGPVEACPQPAGPYPRVLPAITPCEGAPGTGGRGGQAVLEGEDRQTVDRLQPGGQFVDQSLRLLQDRGGKLAEGQHVGPGNDEQVAGNETAVRRHHDEVLTGRDEPGPARRQQLVQRRGPGRIRARAQHARTPLAGRSLREPHRASRRATALDRRMLPDLQ
jgi:hypothetical protein